MARSTATAPFDDARAGAIYRTAARMINQRGFAKTSMNDIAEAVRLTKPGLYYYVKGKKELLYAIMAYAMDLLDAEVMARAQAETDPERRLRVLVARHANLLMRNEHGTIGILIDEVDGLAPDQKHEIIVRKRRYFEFVRRTIEALRSARGLQRIDATVAAFSVLGMVMWLSRWYEADGPLSSDKVADDLVELAVAAVLAERPEPAPFPQSQFTTDSPTDLTRPDHDRQK